MRYLGWLLVAMLWFWYGGNHMGALWYDAPRVEINMWDIRLLWVMAITLIVIKKDK